MGSSGTPPASAQRARTKAPDFSELFRSTHAFRHSSRSGAGTGSSPSSIPSPKEKSPGTKTPSRRSVLPFLGRKKPEQTAAPAVVASPVSRRSVGNAAYPVAPANTVRRSFGNGHAVLMITPSPNALSAEPPLPTKPPINVHPPSFGSKLAAHFTPLRSPSRNSKARYSMKQKSAPPSPPVPSPTALSPPVPEGRAPSIESRHSSMRSRSTTPRPLRGSHVFAGENGDEEDFSDLFTLPDKPMRSQQFLRSTSTTSVHVSLADSPKRSGELTPTTPVIPSGSSLQFPIPPSTVIHPRLILTEKRLSRYSSELVSLSSQGSRSRPSLAAVDGGNSDLSSQDERQIARHRAISISGSDTDTSRANESIRSVSSRKLSPVPRKPSSMKPPKLSGSSTAKLSSGPPPSIPLPSPPLSPNSSSLGPRSAPVVSPNRIMVPRPRATTLSVTSNLVVPGFALPKSKQSLPPRSGRANSDVTPEGTADELREALSQQRRKNIQLQEYIDTITKRHEDDHMAMTKTIEKLERTIRKKMREIEGLRWLVIHNGAVSDIDAAANLARSSFSTQEGDGSDSVRGLSSLLSSSAALPHPDGFPSHQSTPRQQGVNIPGMVATSTSEIRSDTSGSAVSPATSPVSTETTPLAPPPLSAIPEWTDGISRAERQKLKEERRASKALRRISAISTASRVETLSQSSSVDIPLDSTFDPKQSMDEVLEKLQPFRHT